MVRWCVGGCATNNRFYASHNHGGGNLWDSFSRVNFAFSCTFTSQSTLLVVPNAGPVLVLARNMPRVEYCCCVWVGWWVCWTGINVRGRGYYSIELQKRWNGMRIWLWISRGFKGEILLLHSHLAFKTIEYYY